MNDTSVPTLLHAVEAVTLCHALVSEVAATVGCRLLIIKGQSSVWHGLRPPRVSADVDVLLAPADLDRFLQAMAGIGWYERPDGSLITLPAARHSVTLIHDRWPCDVDVHYRFPGLLVEPAEAFDVLWERRMKMPIVGAHVDVPDKVSSIVITALHSVRGTTKQPRHADEFRRLLGLAPTLTEEDRENLREVATLTKADVALDGLLTDLGVPGVTEDVRAKEFTTLRQWREDSAIKHSVAHFWIRYVRQAPPWQWPPRVKTALWPSDAVFLKMHPECGDGRSLNVARLSRLARGIVSLPRTIISSISPSRHGHQARFRASARPSQPADPE